MWMSFSCPMCNGQTRFEQCHHIIGKYNVSFRRWDEKDYATHVYDKYGSAMFVLDGLIPLTEERIDKLILLK